MEKCDLWKIILDNDTLRSILRPMSAPTAEQIKLRKLDAWIECNLFGATGADSLRIVALSDGRKKVGVEYYRNGFPIPHYTAQPGPALLVLAKCGEKYIVCVTFWDSEWHVWDADKIYEGKAITMELAIALFARALFEK